MTFRLPFRVGSNGIGRIGRLRMHHVHTGNQDGSNHGDSTAVVISPINDAQASTAETAHLLAFDSVGTTAGLMNHQRQKTSCE